MSITPTTNNAMSPKNRAVQSSLTEQPYLTGSSLVPLGASSCPRDAVHGDAGLPVQFPRLANADGAGSPMQLRSGRLLPRPLVPQRRPRSGSVPAHALCDATVPLLPRWDLFGASGMPQFWPHPLPHAARLLGTFWEHVAPAADLQRGEESPVLLIEHMGPQPAVATNTAGAIAPPTPIQIEVDGVKVEM